MRTVSTDQTEREGVEAVRFALAKLGWFPKEPERPDRGVDLFVESSDEKGRPGGRLLGVQVKSGPSYFNAEGDGVIYTDHDHVDYWMNYALPVLVVAYDPADGEAFWQLVSEDTVEPTDKAWKVIVPRDQPLDKAALDRLAAIAAPDKAEIALARLRADLTWMELIDQGGSVVLEADEWINKSSGRGDLRLIATPADGEEAVERSFMIFAGSRPYEEALPAALPWARLSLDEEILDDLDDDEYMEETGIWDSEEKRYIGNFEDIEEWRKSRYGDAQLRPYSESAGEVAHWRLSLALNDLGRGVLALERYVSAL